MEDILIKAENGARVGLDPWEDGGVWLYVAVKGSSTSFVIPRDQAKLMLEVLQNILEAESCQNS
jgi:hypothetical protein